MNLLESLIPPETLKQFGTIVESAQSLAANQAEIYRLLSSIDARLGALERHLNIQPEDQTCQTLPALPRSAN